MVYGGNVRALCFALRRGVRWFVVSIWIISVVGQWRVCVRTRPVRSYTRTFLFALRFRTHLLTRISHLSQHHRTSSSNVHHLLTHPSACVVSSISTPRPLALCDIRPTLRTQTHTRNNVYRYVSLLQLNHPPSVARLSVLSLSSRLSIWPKETFPKPNRPSSNHPPSAKCIIQYVRFECEVYPVLENIPKCEAHNWPRKSLFLEPG